MEKDNELKSMFGLHIGDVINTLNRDGWAKFPISLFETDENNITWVILGEVKYLPGFGHYGDRVWRIAQNGVSCWERSKWKKV